MKAPAPGTGKARPTKPSIGRILFWAIAAGVPVLLGVGLLSVLLNPRAQPLKTGVILPTPRPVIDFKLRGANGQPYVTADLRGHWTLIFTGYTHCPDICPTTLAALSQVVGKLGEDAARLKVLFISIDPKRDTPAVLLRYVHAFSPGFIGATGSQAQLKALGLNLGFAWSYDPSTDGHPNDYAVTHSAGMMLIDPQGELTGYFSPPIQVSAMASDLHHIIAGTAVDTNAGGLY